MVSILLPALSSARQTAMAVQCSSSQRQIGLLLSVYANSNRDSLPPAVVKVNGNQWWSLLLPDLPGFPTYRKGPEAFWDTGYDFSSELTPEVLRTSILSCPSVEQVQLSADPAVSRWQSVSYGASVHSFGDQTGWPANGRTKLTQIQSPSSVLLVADRLPDDWGYFYWWDPLITTHMRFRHGGTRTANTLMADMHVESRLLEELPASEGPFWRWSNNAPGY